MHPWNLNQEEARQLQESLASDCVLEGDPDLETIAGIDISVYPESRIGIASAVLYSITDQDILDEVVLIGDLTFPYIPGLLAFREAPLMLKAIMKLSDEPDCLLVDGHGYAHPRRFGLASHLGLLLDTPSIGCAKSMLVGDYEEPGEKTGSMGDIWDGEPIGYAYRSRKGAKPIFLSPGHLINRQFIPEIIETVLDGRTRLPVPLHRSDQLAGRERKLLRDIVRAFETNDPVLIVGGCLRDLMLGHPPEDYDLLVTSLSEKERDALREMFSGHMFPLDEGRKIYRLTGEEIQIDVTEVEENEIVDDLKRRDFTVNSVALDLNQESWIDPLGGREDTEDEILRATHSKSLQSDPIRVLRAYRLAQYHGLQFDQELERQLSDVMDRLTEVSKERIVTELLKIVSGPDPEIWTKKMKKDELFTRVPFFRHEGVEDIEFLQDCKNIFEQFPKIMMEPVHGEYTVVEGIQSVRLIRQKQLPGWPVHHRIKSMAKASYAGLPPSPEFQILKESKIRLFGRGIGWGIGKEISGETLRSRLRSILDFVEQRDRLEKAIVESIDEPANIGEEKNAQLRTRLPNLWEEIVGN